MHAGAEEGNPNEERCAQHAERIANKVFHANRHSELLLLAELLDEKHFGRFVCPLMDNPSVGKERGARLHGLVLPS